MTSVTANPRGRGRPASASPQQVLEAGRQQFVREQRVDVQAIASELGLSRATIDRWFGSREGLLAEVIFNEFRQILRSAEESSRSRGGTRVLQIVDAANRSLARNVPFTLFLAQGQAAFQLVTSTGGQVQPRVVAEVERLIRLAVERDGYKPPVTPEDLAYALVRLSEAFLYNDASGEMRGDVDRLRAVQAALLGVSEAA
jgi:AcrR family transcriptional regulator